MKNIDIIYQNEEIIVINKPNGISCQGGKDVAHPLDKELPLQLGFPVYLVHRLDKETSGLMIIAKSPFAAQKWTNLIGGKQVQKEYTAVCIGKLKKSQGTIKTDIIQHKDQKSAITDYKVIKEKDFTFEDTKTSLCLLNLKLHTGRMHQIRIHLLNENCPILGDDQHGNFKLNKLFKKNLKVKRMMLCATKLIFNENGKEKIIKIDFPEAEELFK